MPKNYFSKIVHQNMVMGFFVTKNLLQKRDARLAAESVVSRHQIAYKCIYSSFFF